MCSKTYQRCHLSFTTGKKIGLYSLTTNLKHCVSFCPEFRIRYSTVETHLYNTSNCYSGFRVKHRLFPGFTKLRESTRTGFDNMTRNRASVPLHYMKFSFEVEIISITLHRTCTKAEDSAVTVLARLISLVL